jgi:hypothetical protein
VPYFPPELVGYVHVQTQYAINSFSSVHFSVACNHSLNTYLHVLDSAAVPLSSDCAPLSADAPHAVPPTS